METILRQAIRRTHALWPRKAFVVSKAHRCPLFAPRFWNLQSERESFSSSAEATHKADAIDALSDTIIITKQCAEV